MAFVVQYNKKLAYSHAYILMFTLYLTGDQLLWLPATDSVWCVFICSKEDVNQCAS